MAKVQVLEHEVRKADNAEYAAYRLSIISESGSSWEITRRWNDLRLCEDTLQSAASETLRARADDIPKFEAHTWRLFHWSKFDPAFLSERARQMEAVVNAWIKVFDITLDEPSGPTPVLDFLSAERQMTCTLTPRSTPRTRPARYADEFSGGLQKVRGMCDTEEAQVLFEKAAPGSELPPSPANVSSFLAEEQPETPATETVDMIESADEGEEDDDDERAAVAVSPLCETGHWDEEKKAALASLAASLDAADAADVRERAAPRPSASWAMWMFAMVLPVALPFGAILVKEVALPVLRAGA